VPELDELPDWPDATVAWLVTVGGDPHAIPVSTALRAGPHRALLALGRRRDSLRRLREDPRVALAVIAPGLAFTAHGEAAVAADPLPGAEKVAAVLLTATRIQDHDSPTFALDEGVRWRWTDAPAEAADARTRAALRALAAGGW